MGLEQWVAAWLGAVGVFGLSRALGAKRVAAYICAGAWMLIPAVVHQVGIALTDLVSVWLVLSTSCSGIWAGWSSVGRCCVLSSVALGLAVGSKQTVLFLAPGLAIVTLAALVVGWHLRSELGEVGGLSFPIVVRVGLRRLSAELVVLRPPFGEPESSSCSPSTRRSDERFSAIETNVRRATTGRLLRRPEPGVGEHVPGLVASTDVRPADRDGRVFERGQPWMGFFVAGIDAGRDVWRRCTKSSGVAGGSCSCRSSQPPRSS